MNALRRAKRVALEAQRLVSLVDEAVLGGGFWGPVRDAAELLEKDIYELGKIARERVSRLAGEGDGRLQRRKGKR